MANKRLAISSQQFQPSDYIHITCLRSKTLFLTLTLVSCLISINCASLIDDRQPIASDNNKTDADSSSDEIHFGQTADESSQQNDTKHNHGKADEVYVLDDSDKTSNSDLHGKDEAEIETASRGQSKSNDKSKTTLLEEEEEAEAPDSSNKNGHMADGAQLNAPSDHNMSVFQRLYSAVASYMPSFGSMNILKFPAPRVESSSSSMDRSTSDASSATESEDSNQDDTNTSVSATKVQLAARDQKGSAVEIKDVIEPNKVVSIKTKSGNKITVAATGKDVVRSDELVGGDESEGDARVSGDFPGDFGSEKKINLIRKSSMMLPYSSNDELLVQPAFGVPKEEPKYIYAPEHHLHLTTSGWSKPSAAEQMYAHRSFPRNVHVDDEPYGPFGSYKSLFATHQDDTYSINGNNKSNDVYFLAMVASFCGMAMAVVLAAGLFAYRVQQQRKATLDTAYPTYGVVGPNNITGKCGAAGFVGGYLPGAGPNSGFTLNKNSKSPPDSFSPTDSGIIANAKPGGAKRSSTEINSGSSSNNSTNFMVNQNAAKMYHYQHQKQQMIISDRASAGRHTSASDLDSEDENDDGSYTVYECPGLASAHEMEIKNPLFNDDQTP